MTSINPSPLGRAASVGTLLTNSPKRAPGALAPRGIIKGAQGPRVQLLHGLTCTRNGTDLCADSATPNTTVSCTPKKREGGASLGTDSPTRPTSASSGALGGARLDLHLDLNI